MMPGKAAVVATLGIAISLAVVTSVAGWRMARQIEWVPVEGSAGWWEDRFSVAVAKLDDLEAKWEGALDSAAEGLLAGEAPRHDVVGVRSVYRLEAQKREAVWMEGVKLDSPPILGRYAEEDEGWVFPDSGLRGRGFMEEADRPLCYVRGDGRQAVVMVLDRAAAAEIAVREAGLTGGKEEGGARWEWLSPAILPESGMHRRADESIRHLSGFGPWTMRVWNPVELKVSYAVPVLAGGFALAGFLLFGGGLLAWIQWRAMRLAARQVSFANQVSHELRTPLTNLMLNADLAMDGVDDADGPVGKRIRAIGEESARLSKTIDQVLDFAKGGGEIRPTEEVDLSKLVREVAARFELPFARQRMRLEVDCPECARVRAAESALERILLNLLSNAERYAGAETTVKVSVFRRNGGWQVEVSDDGPGVPKGAEKRIFIPFVRGKRSTREGASGTGLGLSISRDLAERMGGTLKWLPSERGARFCLSLSDAERRTG